jgi:drug/metabolite transporter (DMT)-like permease
VVGCVKTTGLILKSSRWLTPIAVAGALFFWASAFPAVRAGLHHFSPGHLALARYLVVSLALGVLSLILKPKFPKRRDWPHVALCGLFGFTVYNFTFNYAETRVEAGPASFIVHTAPIFSMILAMIFLGESIAPRSWGGIALSFSGIALLSRGKGGWHFDPFALLLLVTALSASIATILQKRLLARCSALGLITVAAWFGTLFLLPFAPGLGQALQKAPPAALWNVIYLGVFPGALSYALWAWALSKLPVATVVSFLYLVPPLATLLAWLWLGEVPPSFALIGGLLALCGVVLANAGKKN